MTVYSVAIHGTYLGQQVVHQRYYESAGGSASYQDFADGLSALIKTPLQTAVNTGMTYTHLIIRPVAEGSIGSVVVPSGFPFSGIDGGDFVPGFVTARLKLYAAGTEHPVRGMVQLSGLSEAGVSGNEATVAYTATLQAAAAPFASTVTVSGSEAWVPVLWSDTYQRSAPVTGTLASRRLGTQRRRMPGAGS